MKYRWLLLTAAILFIGCSFDTQGISGSGKLITREMSLGDFNKIDASGAFQFDVTQGATSSVIATADDNLWDFVEIRNDGGTLHLDMKPGSYNNSHVSAKIVMPHLNAITTSGASHGSIAGFNDPTNRLDVTLSGASALEGNFQQGHLTLNLDGASKATLHGSADSLDLTLSGASRGDLNYLTTNAIHANLSGASSSNVTAHHKLDYDLSGASHLTYAGNPTIGQSEVSGASSASSAQ
jgi:Putative auto-transporter adhesin, head GIN domain